MTGKTIFISGIDTDCGKTYAAGALATYLVSEGNTVITQKIVQTGCSGIAEDIISHRRIMGIDLFDEDKNGTTNPYVFKLPASPHLAAEKEGVTIDVNVIDNCTKLLQEKFRYVILEGAGGVYVPLTRTYTMIDYLKQYKHPLILVTSGKLGSINSTLMSMEICQMHDIGILGLVFNDFPASTPAIAEDSYSLFEHELFRRFGNRNLVRLPILNEESASIPDFSCFF